MLWVLIGNTLVHDCPQHMFYEELETIIPELSLNISF